MDTQQKLKSLVDQLNTVVVGKAAQMQDCVACLLAGGHLLIEDVPGVGKTTLAHALAKTFGLQFSRVQFTADLMPSDLSGVSIYERAKESFVFHPGPLFAQVLLADEINRASPKTQSALLEAMEEKQVTVDGETRALPAPFFVIATQNPLDQIGTYALPESQMDRFFMRISLGYPDRQSERELLTGLDRREMVDALPSLLDAAQLQVLQQQVRAVHTAPALLDYVQDLIAATRSGQWFLQGSESARRDGGAARGAGPGAAEWSRFCRSRRRAGDTGSNHCASPDGAAGGRSRRARPGARHAGRGTAIVSWLQRWIESRLPLRDSITLTQRTVYILPTGAGFMLGATLTVLLLASINYQLNLGYLLTFLLAGSAVVGMQVGHATLRGMTISLSTPQACFAQSSALLDIHLQCNRRRARHGIGLALRGGAQWVWSDVPAQGSVTAQVAFTPPQRGLHRVPTLTAQTLFPLGTFRVWTIWRPSASVLVYPAPEPAPPPLPPGQARSGISASTPLHTGDDYDGVRGYRRSDPLKLIVWKKVAKADELVSRDAQQAQRLELWLDPQHCGVADPERQLSRLCAWVLQAEKMEIDYGLRLGALEIRPGRGDAHHKQCLQALARHGLNQAPS